MLRELWENGFDLIVVDYEGGADFIQRNGYAFQEFMKFIKDEYAIDEIPAVIGPSIGAQIIRFALFIRLGAEQSRLLGGTWRAIVFICRLTLGKEQMPPQECKRERGKQ